jgi:hypothetical protein
VPGLSDQNNNYSTSSGEFEAMEEENGRISCTSQVHFVFYLAAVLRANFGSARQHIEMG